MTKRWILAAAIGFLTAWASYSAHSQGVLAGERSVQVIGYDVPDRTTAAAVYSLASSFHYGISTLIMFVGMCAFNFVLFWRTKDD